MTGMPQTMQDAELASWLRLQHTPGVGPETARRLLAAFGLPEQVFAASFAALREVVSERIAAAVCAAPDRSLAQQLERTRDWLAQPGHHLLTLADAAYPIALLDIADPPIMLFAAGRLELLDAPSLAVVGSRNASTQGIIHAQQFSQSLSQAGVTIVSGLALGIDTAAHQGALLGRGSTVAVIGTGADIVYPARNRALAQRLTDEGLIVSEYPLGTPPIAANFPRRNRLISGLSRAVLVVEAAAKSGSLITARLAAEQGRDVFAIPGSIHSALAKGCHLLIKEGAKLVETAQDILEEMPGLVPPPQQRAEALPPHASWPDGLDATQAALLAAIGYDPVDGDTLMERCGMGAASLNAQLLTLELAGLVEALPGGRYRRLQGHSENISS